ncbi:ring-cleaving dioxygenase [Ruoffia tabacinasalis]|uniref:ring-cleaving dioxygenase n=1 Tax=Ruoffia tabacinasalis TaxID=87458 RepID=UPI003F9B845A
MEPVKHLHHITAIAGPPQENLHFYRDVLGLKLIKQTVNFDDVNTYHFYFSNKGMDDGTILTFFPWDTRNRGVKGSGQVGRIAFSVPNGSLEHWKKHLETHDVVFEESNMFGNRGIIFEDNHTLRLAIVETDAENKDSDILGFYGVELLSSRPEATRDTLRDQLGLEELEATLEFFHLETIGEQRHHIIIPKEAPARGRDGVGTVHHVAWSMEDDLKQQEWRKYLQDEGFHVTEVKDRNYFKAMYMREKGHVLFEYATDGPGFAVDEPVDALGQKLMLPEQYESQREEIERTLPKVEL